MKYYWLIITILFGIKLIKGKKLSSYNIKWMIVYMLYLWIMQAEVYSYEMNWEEESEYFIWTIFILPFAVYMIFPFIWEALSKLKVFSELEETIDKWYNKIKSL